LLRALFLYFSKASWARRIVAGWGIARRAASRFVAGDTLDDAIAAVRTLNQQGLLATLDHLGENVNGAGEALRASDDYLALLTRLSEEGVRANASLKLTQLGLQIDRGLCLSNMQCVARQAAAQGTFVRIDMEDSSSVDRTLEIQAVLQTEGFTQIGLVIQSYLYRSPQDLAILLDAGVCIRLVKGAYNEPADIAFPRKSDVDAAFDRLAAMLIDAAKVSGARPGSSDGKIPPMAAIATHDEARIEFAKSYAQKVGLPQAALEFQMLYGIRSELQIQLSKEGYPIRVYVPYGTEWYPYFMRRLAERPANLWFFLTNLLRR
jgi:proline dehydrogenase